MASLDVRRPAAQEQLKVLGEQIGVDTLPIIAGQMPVDISSRAINDAKLGGYAMLAVVFFIFIYVSLLYYKASTPVRFQNFSKTTISFSGHSFLRGCF